jgi:hypothetical protein
MYKMLLTLLTILNFSLSAEAEDYQAKNNVYLECFGNTGAYSINYEYMPQETLAGRVGVGYFAEHDKTVLTIPLMANYLMGETDHRFELGAGTTIVVIEGDGHYLKQKGAFASPTITAGYRYQPRCGGMLFRAGLTPIFTPRKTVTSVGFSIGNSF